MQNSQTARDAFRTWNKAIRRFLASTQVHSPPSHHPACRPRSTFGGPIWATGIRGSARCARARPSRGARAVENSQPRPPRAVLRPGSQASLPSCRQCQEPLPGATRELSGAAYAPGTAPPSAAARGRVFLPGQAQASDPAAVLGCSPRRLLGPRGAGS